jgi:hypothetical protein
MHNIFFYGYQTLGPNTIGTCGRGLKLTTHLHLMQYLHSPIRLLGVVLYQLNTGTKLPFVTYQPLWLYGFVARSGLENREYCRGDPLR